MKKLQRFKTLHRLIPPPPLRFEKKPTTKQRKMEPKCRRTLSCIKCHLLNKHAANQVLNPLDGRQSLLLEPPVLPLTPGPFIMSRKVSNLSDSIKMLIKLRAGEGKHSKAVVTRQKDADTRRRDTRLPLRHYACQRSYGSGYLQEVWRRASS